MEWHNKERLPTIRNDSQIEFSIDVLIYSITFKTHTIGWYDFKSNQWLFLNSENQSYFKWRYLTNKYDKP